MSILQSMQQLKRDHKSAFALLIDPDNISIKQLEYIASTAISLNIGYILIGGSIMIDDKMYSCIQALKKSVKIPIILFPGNPNQVVSNADAILYLTLVSGRNPDLLIGQHVTSAPIVKRSKLEVISTGYMVIDGGKPTTVSYMSHSQPIPMDKPDIALCTAWAAELQGKHVIYMDAGSGAQYPIQSSMIELVSQNIEIPLIIGGGIKTPEKVMENSKAGANIIVVGNAIEKEPTLLQELASAVL